MNWKRTHVEKQHEEFGKSGLSILQLSGKSDISTHQPYPNNNKNLKETALGKLQLFPVQISSKPDTSICWPKKQNTKKSKDTVLGKSELCPVEISGKSDKLTFGELYLDVKANNYFYLNKLHIFMKETLGEEIFQSKVNAKQYWNDLSEDFINYDLNINKETEYDTSFNRRRTR